MKKISSILFLLAIYSQGIVGQPANKPNGLTLIASNNPGSNWYIFDKGTVPSQENINSTGMKKYFGFDNDNSFSLVKSATDELKMTHHTFQQMYKGYPVQLAIFKLHEFQDKPTEGNGHWIADLTKNLATPIPFAEALNLAKQYFPAQLYMWEDSLEQASWKIRKQDTSATYFPKKELIWATTSKNLLDMNADNFTLAYKIILGASRPSFTKEIYIDALSGKLLNAFDLEYNCGTYAFNSNFNGSRTVSYSTSLFTDNLIDNCGLGDAIFTSDNATTASPYTKSAFLSWPNTNNFNSACTSMWSLREAENYFYNVHARNGWTGAPFNIDLRQNAIFYYPNGTPYYQNASFNGAAGICKVGNNESGGPNGSNVNVLDDINSVDVLAHELTHGVTYNSAGLVYQGESGALNESFSDIFGINAYQYLGGYSPANLWKIGYDIIMNGSNWSLRDMANPHSKNNPDTYLTDAFWVDTATVGDAGGVHTNSGVQNYMYYLLVAGGSGTNTNGFSYTISGIGFTAGRAIAYRALTAGYLNPNSNHSEARSAWVHAAIDLYGNCSVESQTVGKAWEAAGVGSFWYYGNNICGNYSGTQFLSSNSPYFISNTGCATTILGTGNQVSFNGADFVDIYPGFNTNTGAYFVAKTNNCWYSNY